MSRARACLALALLLATGRAAAIADGEPPTDAEFEARFPWAVVIVRDGGTGVCTGSLVAPRHVLTAAHCAGEGLTVLFGSRSREAGRRVPVRGFVRHPRYTTDPITHDLAVLRLARPLRVPPVPLAGPAETWLLVRPGTSATILGWGNAGGGIRRPDIVRQAEVHFAELGMVGTLIAFYSPRGGPCGGDSGGPLVMEGHDGQPVLVGVASITDGNLCAAGKGRAGYTRVALLLDFIRQHVPDLPERAPPLEFGAMRATTP